jgi:hypothetical protein
LPALFATSSDSSFSDKEDIAVEEAAKWENFPHSPDQKLSPLPVTV